MRSAAATFVTVIALVGVLLVAVEATPDSAFAAPPTTGSLVVDESFSDATVNDPAWIGLGGACLTGAPAGSTPSPTIRNCGSSRSGPVPLLGSTPGYLQLTDTSTYASGTILFNRALPASAGISVVFEQYQYGGTGADGIGFFLVDGSTNLTKAGGTGGSLGYAQRSGVDGILGGYIGVGLDAFGNFYDDGEGRGLNCPAGQRAPSVGTGAVAPNVITLRGPGSARNGYCYQASTTNPASDPHKPTSTLAGALRAINGTTDPAVARRLVNIQVTPAPNARVIVQIDFGAGSGWQEVLNRTAPANPPSTYKFGFSGATGGMTDVHLLRNITVRTIAPLTDLQITKQVDRTSGALPAMIVAGTPIPYQYVVTNAGLEVVSAVVVSDDKVASVTCASTTLPPAPDPAASTLCHGTYTVTAADVMAGAVTNLAQASAADPGGTPVVSNTDTVTVPVVSKLSLAKTVVTAAPYAVGQQVSYAFSIVNSGGSTISTIAVKDSRTAAGTVVCNAANLDAGQSSTCSLTTTILAGQLTPDGSLLNTAVAAGQTPLGQQVTSNTAQASIQVGTDVLVSKSVDNSTPVVGQRVTFTVTAVNVGPGQARSVVINDLLPSGLTLVSFTASNGVYAPTTGNWTIANLPLALPAEPATLTLTATIDTAAVVTNAASLTSVQQPDINPANNTASVSLNPIVPTTDIAVQVSVDTASIRVGGTATFTISATNNGPDPATGVTIIDTLPSRLQFVSAGGGYSPATGIWTIGSLAIGQTVSTTITVIGSAVGSFQNTAGLTTVSPRDVNQSNDVASASLAVTSAIADLQLVKSIVSGVDNVHIGDFVTYSLTITNAGPDAVADAVVTENQVDGLAVQAQDFTASNPSQGTVDAANLTWDVGLLAPGATATIVVRAEVMTAGTKANVATVVSASTQDPDLDNNIDTASFSTGPTELDISVTKTLIGPTEVPLGRSVSFSVTATNNGPADATTVTFYDPIPEGLEFDAASVSAGSYDAATGLWLIPAILHGQSETMTATLTAVEPGVLTNTVSLQSLDEADTETANNTSSASVDIVVLADLEITKSVSPTTAQPDGTLEYTVSVTNNGPNTAESVQAVDPLRIDSTITGSTVSQGSFDASARRWDIGTLVSGQTATLTLTVRITRTGTFLNTVVISQSSVPDPELADNRALAIVDIPSADLAIDVTSNETNVSAGQRVTITIAARNAGPDPSTAVVVSDLLPAGLTYVSSVATAGAYDAVTGVWSIGTVTAGAAATLTIVARVSAWGSPSGSITNSATVSSGFPVDPDESDNSDSIEFTIGRPGVSIPNQLSEAGVSAFPGILAATAMLITGTIFVHVGRRRRRALART